MQLHTSPCMDVKHSMAAYPPRVAPVRAVKGRDAKGPSAGPSYGMARHATQRGGTDEEEFHSQNYALVYRQPRAWLDAKRSTAAAYLKFKGARTYWHNRGYQHGW